MNSPILKVKEWPFVYQAWYKIGTGPRLGFLENSLTQRLMSWLEGAEPGTQEWGGKEEWDREGKRANIEEEAPKLATTY